MPPDFRVETLATIGQPPQKLAAPPQQQVTTTIENTSGVLKRLLLSEVVTARSASRCQTKPTAGYTDSCAPTESILDNVPTQCTRSQRCSRFICGKGATPPASLYVGCTTDG